MYNFLIDLERLKRDRQVLAACGTKLTLNHDSANFEREAVWEMIQVYPDLISALEEAKTLIFAGQAFNKYNCAKEESFITKSNEWLDRFKKDSNEIRHTVVHAGVFDPKTGKVNE